MTSTLYRFSTLTTNLSTACYLLRAHTRACALLRVFVVQIKKSKCEWVALESCCVFAFNWPFNAIWRCCVAWQRFASIRQTRLRACTTFTPCPTTAARATAVTTLLTATTASWKIGTSSTTRSKLLQTRVYCASLVWFWSFSEKHRFADVLSLCST